MGVSKRQMQNFLIYVLDMVGLTAGYFVAVYLRFGNLKTAYGFMRADTYLRWITAMAVLTFVYLLFHPNRSFFKRKIKDEIRCDFQTAVLTGAGMSMIALLMSDASKYSRFIYMFTIGFEFFYMIIVHRLYRKYWLRRRSNHSFARKMMLITTSGEAEQVITNIIKEKIWDLWITSIVIIDKDMVGENVCGIPVIGFTYRSIFEYAARNVVDEVFIYIPKEYKYPVAMTIQNFEDMGINTSLNIPLFQINQNLNKTLETVGPYNVVSFSGREVSLFMLLLKRAMDIPVHINGNEKKKKTEYRNSYIAYLNIQNVILMCCLLLFGVWLWTELYISTNLNIFWINDLLCVAIILSSFKSLKFEGNFYICGDDCRLTDRLQKNGRGKKKIYV